MKEKLVLFKDLGTIIVPDDYDHATRLDSFRKKNRKKFYYCNDDITDANFAEATTKLVPGRRLRVKVFWQIFFPRTTTTSKECMAFLERQNTVLTSAQGASLVFEQKRDELPMVYRYYSFDKKDALWKDADGAHRMPYVCRLSDRLWSFDLGSFEYPWFGNNDLLLGFFDCD